jgi:spore maturation protein CgeB
VRVLLVDTTQYFPASPLFLEALEELSEENGYEFDFVDEGIFLQLLARSLIHKAAYRLLGRRPLGYWAFNRTLLERVRHLHPDVVLVVKGAYISPKTIRIIKRETNAVLVNYATDDPFNPQANTRDLVKGISSYDLYVCQKKAIMDDTRRSGCKSVTYLPIAYKPSVHFPEKAATAAEEVHFTSDVAFIGGCDSERIPYFRSLVRELPDIDLHLYGGYWDRDPVLCGYHRGFAVGRDYRLALSGTKIAVNLVRRSNRDGHTMRSFEVPACGAFMLAERTEEHLELFREGKEIACFGSTEELLEKVRYYLAHGAERERIAEEGYRRVTSFGNTYKDRLVQILSLLVHENMVIPSSEKSLL